MGWSRMPPDNRHTECEKPVLTQAMFTWTQKFYQARLIHRTLPEAQISIYPNFLVFFFFGFSIHRLAQICKHNFNTITMTFFMIFHWQATYLLYPLWQQQKKMLSKWQTCWNSQLSSRLAFIFPGAPLIIHMIRRKTKTCRCLMLFDVFLHSRLHPAC